LIVTLPSASSVTAGTFGFLTFIRQSAQPDRYGKQRVLTQSPRSNSKQDAALLAEMLSLANDGRYR
jgi:hypothetical protein